MHDNAFIRGSLPMTKSEVRAVSLSKLELVPGAVFWDVGAGTGSVSVEAARQLLWMENGSLSVKDPKTVQKKSRIFAVEQEAEGIDLIEKNRKNCVPEYKGFSIVHGTAPKALVDLPAPTHVFIGGSKGKLFQIVRFVLEKNPRARLVIHAVTAESLASCLEIIQTFSFSFYEIVSVAVTRLEMVGTCHMHRAQNPVYIILLQGGSHGT